ncbi:MAG: LysR family transcriptional regulator [Kofleriaceae bacterium]
MRGQLESLIAFVTAADAGSLSAAARVLKQPLPTVSRKVADLERHVGTPLFVRTSRQLQITDAGAAYLVTARRVLEDLAAADNLARGEQDHPRGELAIAAPLVFGRWHVLPIVTELLRSYPEIRVRLVLSDRIASFADDHLDVAVRIGALVDSSLIAQRVGSVRRVMVASADYLAKRGRPRKLEDLSKHDLISFDTSWDVRARLIVNTAEAAIDAARAGLGITRLLSYQASADLERVLKSADSEPIPVQLVRTTHAVPRKVRVFLDLAAERLLHALAGIRA